MDIIREMNIVLTEIKHNVFASGMSWKLHYPFKWMNRGKNIELFFIEITFTDSYSGTQIFYCITVSFLSIFFLPCCMLGSLDGYL